MKQLLSEELRQLGDIFKQDGIKSSIKIIHLPGFIIFRAFYEQIFQAPVTLAAGPHFHKDLGDVMSCYLVSFQDP